MSDERRLLAVLGLLHYVLGCLAAFFFSLFLPYVWMNVHRILVPGSAEASPVPSFLVAWMAVVLPVFFLLGGWWLAGLLLLAGSRLRHHRNRSLCLVVAGMECIIAPLGTLLGLYTLRILARETVREIFLARAIEDSSDEALLFPQE